MITARHNPFTVRRIQALGYLPQDRSWPQLHARLSDLNFTAAIVGPHGSGKTTLLRHLETQLRHTGTPTAMLFMNLETKLSWTDIRRTICSLPPRSVLCFDGACHLSFLRFRRLRYLTRKQNIGLLITSHQEGRLPTLTRCRPRPELLTELARHLLPEHETIDSARLSALFSAHNGNLRDCLWQLYDDYAQKNSKIVSPIPHFYFRRMSVTAPSPNSSSVAGSGMTTPS